MFLANKGMTAFLMCPFRATSGVSGVSQVNNTVTYMYEGPMWTQQEADTFRNQLTYTTTGMTLGNSLAGLFNAIRRSLGYTSGSMPTLQGQTLTNKAYGKTADEACFRMRAPVTVKLTGGATGILGVLIVVTYSTYNTNTTGLIAVMSVGLPGSGAEVELEDTNIASGNVIQLNDLYLRLSGLLGES